MDKGTIGVVAERRPEARTRRETVDRCPETLGRGGSGLGVVSGWVSKARRVTSVLAASSCAQGSPWAETGN